MSNKNIGFSFLGGELISSGLREEIIAGGYNEPSRVKIKPPYKIIVLLAGLEDEGLLLLLQEEIVALPIPGWVCGYSPLNPWDSAVLEGGYCLRGEVQEIVEDFLINFPIKKS